MDVNIQLIAMDLDDTLLDHDRLISKENHDAIIAAEDRGIRVVLASGRSPFGMQPYLEKLEMHRREGFAICFNGAVVKQTDTHEELMYEGLPDDVARQVLEWAESRQTPIQTYKADTIYVTRENAHTHIDSKLTRMQKISASPEEILALKPIKYVLPGDPELLQGYQSELRELLGSRAGVFVSKPYFLEVMAPMADKGHALAFLSKRLGVPREQVMAIGDAPNDLGMLRWAGYSVAMSNALPEIHAAADWVTTRDNHHAGVAEAVERLLLT